MKGEYDVAVIGAGVVGSAIARESVSYTHLTKKDGVILAFGSLSYLKEIKQIAQVD